MMGFDHHSPRLFHSLRRLADTGWAAIQNRVELFAVEFREEESYAAEILCWGVAAVLFIVLTMVVLTATIVLLFDPESRVYVAGGFCFLYFLGALTAILGLKSRLKNRPEPFSETIDQMKKDRQWLIK
jgi:uncharacterized membrane protein YqjE